MAYNVHATLPRIGECNNFILLSIFYIKSTNQRSPPTASCRPGQE